MPLKLLKPKRLAFATEEEFIEHFLAEKLKQEAEERTSESKINSKLTTKGPQSSGLSKKTGTTAKT